MDFLAFLPQGFLEGKVLVWIGINNRLKDFLSLVSHARPDPPKSPLRRGVGVDFDLFQVPPSIGRL